MAALSVLTRPPSVEPEVEAVVVLVVAAVAAAADIPAVVVVVDTLVVAVAGTPEGGTAKIVEVTVAKVVDTVVDKAGMAAVAAMAVSSSTPYFKVAKSH
jgi:hypothetical protein